MVDGVTISRGGGPYSVYIWAGLAMVAARLRVGPLRRVRPDVVIDTQNGVPFLARLAFGRRVAVLVHHCHREQWPVAGRFVGRLGWLVESWLSPRMHRRNQYVTVSLPSARDLSDLGVDAARIAVVRNGLDEAPAETLTAQRSATPRVVVLSRLVPHKQIEDALDAVAALRPRVADLHLDIVGGGWWHERLVERAHRLGIADAVTFHGHVDDRTKHAVVQRSWVHVLPSRKEGWGLAVIEAAQHGVPTIGYRSSGGLTDSVIDGVTGVLVDDHHDLVDRLEQPTGRTCPARRARRQGQGAQPGLLLAAERRRDAQRVGVGARRNPCQWCDLSSDSARRNPLQCIAYCYGNRPAPRAGLDPSLVDERARQRDLRVHEEYRKRHGHQSD